jgi:plastocyanin
MRKEATKAAARDPRALGRRRIVTAGAVALAAVAAGGVVGTRESGAQYGPYPPPNTTPTPTPAPTHKRAKGTVVIKGTSSADYRFSPHTLKVKHGKRVKWTWNSNAPHNITFRKLHKHSTTVQSGTYRRRFKKRGTYRYLCTVHGFTGKVVVK